MDKTTPREEATTAVNGEPNAVAPKTANLWREPAGAVPNSLALGYAILGYAAGLALSPSSEWIFALAGVLLVAHAMVIAAYLIHEAAHYTLFSSPAHNRLAGETMSWIAGSAYASFDRIRHLHLRHHRDRADVTCFDYKAFVRARPQLQRAMVTLEWAHFPAVEVLMHAQVMLRPFCDRSQRRYLPRAAIVLALRIALLSALAVFSVQAALLYLVAYTLFLTVLNFFDAFHHTFEQYFVEADAVVPMNGRDRSYEQANTFSNVVSIRWPWLNLLTLNFGYHNAHHERAAAPWYRLPPLHRELFGAHSRELMPLSELWRTWYRNRVRRVIDDDYGAVGEGDHRADGFIGAHGVSFLTVV